MSGVDLALALDARMCTDERFVHPLVYPYHLQLTQQIVASGLSPIGNMQMLSLSLAAASVGMATALAEDTGLAGEVYDADGLPMVIDNLREAAAVLEALRAERFAQ